MKENSDFSKNFEGLKQPSEKAVENIENNETHSELSDIFKEITAKTELKLHNLPLIGSTWYEIDYHVLPSMRNNIGIETYPHNTKLYLRCPSTKEIKYWSTMDVEDITGYDMVDKIDYIISQCVKAEIPLQYNGRTLIGNYKDIIESDRLYLLLSLRELMFGNSTQGLTFNLSCPKCGEKNQVQVTKDNIGSMEFEDDVKVLGEFWNADERCFNVETDVGDFTIYLSTIGLSSIIRKYIMESARKSEMTTDIMASIKTACLMCKNWRELDSADTKTFYKKTENYVKHIDKETDKWTPNKIIALNETIKTITDPINVNLTYVCEHCYETIQTPFQTGESLIRFFNVPRISDTDSVEGSQRAFNYRKRN